MSCLAHHFLSRLRAPRSLKWGSVLSVQVEAVPPFFPQPGQ